MRISTSVVVMAALMAAPPATPAVAQDADRSVTDGGVHVPGWEGRVDRRPLSRGMSIADSRMAEEDGAFRLSVGPAAFFWNPANRAGGDYEVSATFEEHAMSSSHPHPYGIFIGGSNLRSDQETLLYCIVYADGTYAVKTFHGETVTTLHDRGPHEAIRTANEAGEATNTVGWRVQDGTATCLINGAEAASFPSSETVGPDRLESLDGIYGIRVSHNLELTVRDFRMTPR